MTLKQILGCVCNCKTHHFQYFCVKFSNCSEQMLLILMLPVSFAPFVCLFYGVTKVTLAIRERQTWSRSDCDIVSLGRHKFETESFKYECTTIKFFLCHCINLYYFSPGCMFLCDAATKYFYSLNPIIITDFV